MDNQVVINRARDAMNRANAEDRHWTRDEMRDVADAVVTLCAAVERLTRERDTANSDADAHARRWGNAMAERNSLRAEVERLTGICDNTARTSNAALDRQRAEIERMTIELAEADKCLREFGETDLDDDDGDEPLTLASRIANVAVDRDEARDNWRSAHEELDEAGIPRTGMITAPIIANAELPVAERIARLTVERDAANERAARVPELVSEVRSLRERLKDACAELATARAEVERLTRERDTAYDDALRVDRIACQIGEAKDRLAAEVERLTGICDNTARTSNAALDRQRAEIERLTIEGRNARIEVERLRAELAAMARRDAWTPTFANDVPVDAPDPTVCGECDGTGTRPCNGCPHDGRRDANNDCWEACPPCPACGGKGTREVKL